MTQTLIITVIILSIIAGLYILINFLTRRGLKIKLERQNAILNDAIFKNKLEIDEKETINNYLFAIDRINFELLYINFNESNKEPKLIDLWRIKAVKVTTEDNMISEETKDKSMLVDRNIVKIQMEITLSDNASRLNLPLYQYNDGMQDLVQIRKRADHWCQLIKICLREQPDSPKRKVMI